MHHVDRDTMWDEIWQAMEVLVAQGKIIYVGSSNFAAWHIAQANDTAAARGSFGLVSEQSIYNLLTREVELEVLPAAIEYGVGVIPWSPSARRAARRRAPLRSAKGAAGWRAGPGRSSSRTVSGSRLTRTCATNSATSLPPWRWPGCCTRGEFTGPIIGPRTATKLDDAQRAVTLSLEDDILKRLDDLFPGYRPAPEHYAW